MNNTGRIKELQKKALYAQLTANELYELEMRIFFQPNLLIRLGNGILSVAKDIWKSYSRYASMLMYTPFIYKADQEKEYDNNPRLFISESQSDDIDKLQAYVKQQKDKIK